MNRSRLAIGRKSSERGSTFKQRGAALSRGKGAPRRAPISPASPEQRAKVAAAVSIVSAQAGCDPAHLWPRGRGGCDLAVCVVPLTSLEHRSFDDGELDILPHLVAGGLAEEIGHAVVHAGGDLIAVLHRLTGDRYIPDPKRPFRSTGPREIYDA